jgi:hypothetical protein
MAIIPNFPQELADLHHNWHEPGSHPGLPSRVHPYGTPGGGVEFLQFHHDIMAQFRTWYAVQPFGTAPFDFAPFQNAASANAAVAAWTAIPASLKNSAVTSWTSVQAAQDTRIVTNDPRFSSADDLGTYIEGGIHSWIHTATAIVFDEPVVGTLHSPQSTYFYNIHGLVDYWWTRWQFLDTPVTKFHPETKHIIVENKAFLDTLVSKADPETKPNVVDAVINKRVIFETPPVGGGGGDPGPFVNQLMHRVAILEGQMATGRAFIRPEERPDVGAAARRADRSSEKKDD